MTIVRVKGPNARDLNPEKADHSEYAKWNQNGKRPAMVVPRQQRFFKAVEYSRLDALFGQFHLGWLKGISFADDQVPGHILPHDRPHLKSPIGRPHRLRPNVRIHVDG